MLLTGAADAFDSLERRLILQSLEDEVQGLEPHGYWRVHLALLRHYVNAFGNAILGTEVAVEVDLGLGYHLEIRGYDNC